MLGVVRDLPSAFDAPSSNLHLTWKPLATTTRASTTTPALCRICFRPLSVLVTSDEGASGVEEVVRQLPKAKEQRFGLQTRHDDGLMAGVEPRISSSKSLVSNAEPWPTTPWLTSAFAVLPPATLDF